MKTKLVRPKLVEHLFNSLEEMNGDLILRNGTLYTHATIPSLKKYETDRVFELILISLEDEKIEVGDKWIYICPINGVDYGDKGDAIVTNNLKSNWFDKLHDKTNYKKVIATQDQLSPEYIAKFVEQYNNGKVDDIEIEMEEFCDEQTIASASGFSLKVPINIEYKPKLTNGFVTIVNKEPIFYTEEEVYKLLKLGIGQAISYPEQFVTGICFDNILFNNWFNQNKKK